MVRGITKLKYFSHPRLTRDRGIRFLLFEFLRALVYNQTIFKLTDLLVLDFSFKMHLPAKKCLMKKAKKLCLIAKLWSKVTAFWTIDRTVKSTCSELKFKDQSVATLRSELTQFWKLLQLLFAVGSIHFLSDESDRKSLQFHLGGGEQGTEEEGRGLVRGDHFLLKDLEIEFPESPLLSRF